MAENQFQEKTEQATPKRLRDARRKGQVARSKELSMALIMICGSSLLFLFGDSLLAGLFDLVTSALSYEPALAHDPALLPGRFASLTIGALALLAPLLVVLPIAAIAGGAALGGLTFSFAPIKPKMEKLSLLKGIKRIFGPKGLVEVAKSLSKAAVVGSVAFAVLWQGWDGIAGLGMRPLGDALTHAAGMIATTLLLCSLSLVVIVGIDVPFQLWNHAKQMRMTRQEVVDEQKQTEGRPEVRQRIREKQQDAARQRMLQDVPDADVVVTNPRHFAVALRYDASRMSAPVVVASGMGHLASRIREVATKHRVPLFEAPVLARALYWNVKPGAQILPELYGAVAQVLTYILRIKRYVAGSGQDWPARPAVELDETLAVPPAARGSDRTE